MTDGLMSSPEAPAVDPLRGRAALDVSDLVIVANRLPVRWDSRSAVWRRSPGGLVSALEPALRGVDASWVGWAGDDDPDALPHGLGPSLHAVTMSAREYQDFYVGFCNSTLWPLYHQTGPEPSCDAREWSAYVTVNRRFAEAAAERAAHGAMVWVHDTHLQLVPAMLRHLRPDLRIGFFLHTPFPDVSALETVPWAPELVSGLLGGDLLGFQAARDAGRFTDAAVLLGGVGTGRQAGTVVLPDGRDVRLGVFPVSIDTQAFAALATRPSTRAAAARLRAEWGDPRWVLLGVDRLDYTKGIDARIRAFAELRAEGSLPDAVMVQVATPSREDVPAYREHRAVIEELVGRVVGEHSGPGSPALHYLHRTVDVETLAALYVAADVMLVTPYNDGMNLVAKEYVASRPGSDGALVLSRFAGCADELPEAYLVDPHSTEDLKRAITSARDASPRERARRMHAMRRRLFAHDTTDWRRDFLDALGGARPC